MKKRIALIICALALLVSCSHQHYAYLNAAEQRENVTAAQREEYAAFVRTLPEDTWLHVHCQGGVGRTNMYLVFYDFLRNPDVPEKDVIYRHFNQGGNFMYYKGDKPNEEAYKVPLAQEKAEMIPLVYKYIQDQQPKGFKRSWAQWKAKK